MPSGLTEWVYRGNSSLKDYALKVAAHSDLPTYWLYMENREQPFSEEWEIIIPNKSYLEAELKKYEEEKNKWDSIKGDSIALTQEYEKYCKSQKDREENLISNNETRAGYYNSMIDSVNKWQVPESLADLKKNMLYHLRENLSHDCGGDYHISILSFEERKAETERDINWNIDNCTRELKKHSDWCNAAVSFMSDLYKALWIEPKIVSK